MTDIDLVYLWVDGNDPKWIEKHNAFTGHHDNLTGENCEGRYSNHDELKYSLRSIEKYAPWIRRIFIVTDSQRPAWLDPTNPKIKIVDHTEIMPPESLPSFNSAVIEHHLHNIEGLAEHYLYANDDMYLNRPVTPETFFTADGKPIARLNRRPFRKLSLWYAEKIKGKTISNYKKTIHNSALLVEKRYGRYFTGKTHHNIDSYCKSDVRHAYEVFRGEISETLANHVRAANDLQRNLYTYVALAEHRARLIYVSQRTSFRLHIDNRRHYDKLKRYNPTFFCMNDSEYASEADRKRAAEFLAELFPEKSQFEK